MGGILENQTTEMKTYTFVAFCSHYIWSFCVRRYPTEELEDFVTSYFIVMCQIREKTGVVESDVTYTVFIL